MQDENISIVSGALKEASLEPGLYLRTLDGKIIPVVFSQSELPEDIVEGYPTLLPWPKTDFVYDLTCRSVFSQNGKFHQYIRDSRQDGRAGIDEEYRLYSDTSVYRVESGYDQLMGEERSKRQHRGLDWVGGVEGQLIGEDEYFELASISLVSQALRSGVNKVFHDQLLAVASQMSDGSGWEGIKIPDASPLKIGEMDVLTIHRRDWNQDRFYFRLDINAISHE